ncbi:hypothetical protein NCC49_004588 [Naganishia albida]|nr:hypothetical protein NCC49_004588 [Naganishia albida]
MHFPLALTCLGLLASFVNAAPPSLGRRNNGGHPTSISPTTTAQATTRTVTANCATATASSAVSSGTSYVLVVSNGTLSGLVPAGSGGDGAITVSLLSLEPQAGTNSDNANLTSSSGSYFIPTTSDAFFIRNEYGNITADKISVLGSTSVVPSSTSPAAPTATAGILDDFGALFDDIVDAAEDLVDAVVTTALLPVVSIPVIIVDLAEDAVEIIGDVVQIVLDVGDLVVEGIEEILEALPDIPLPIVPLPIVPVPTSGLASSTGAPGPEPSHSGDNPALGVRPLGGDSAVVVVCRDGGEPKDGKKNH